MPTYERIPYSSFFWKLGTTSFRTKEFNRMTEWQLRLLKEFWEKPENANLGWETAVEGQKDIYEIKNRYYDWLVENKFTRGDDSVKYKAAREKTSGLYDMGLINNEHRLTEVGLRLLDIAHSEDYLTRTELGISKDSQLYLEQLLKLSDKNTGAVVRPFIIVSYLLIKLEYLTNEEFRYLLPLCTNSFTTNYIYESIINLRMNSGNIDDILRDFLLSRENYRSGLERFKTNEFSKELLLSIGMNRKSASYDKSYVPLYEAMHSVYMENDSSKITDLFEASKNFQSSISIKWKQLLFDTSNSRAIHANPKDHLRQLPDGATNSEASFKEFFFVNMHISKIKATLEDYQDLNRRYLGLTNCFLFENNQVKFDIVPKQFFSSAIDELYSHAFKSSDLLFVNSTLDQICPALCFNAQNIIDGVNRDLGTNVDTIEEAYNEVDRIRYERFNQIVAEKFDNKTLLRLLNDFDQRNDDDICSLVTDNADVPTIFEYVLGIIWYKASERKGKVLDYMKLSLDANLLPISHAAGGEADIVYEYSQTKYYPAHCLLLEATLADSTNQRRMEMEPVSRHLGNHLLSTGNQHSYCVFATTFLHINVISDFMSRKYTLYVDPQDDDRYISGMKIIPLETTDLRYIVSNNVLYRDLYKHFDKAYVANGRIHPRRWYQKYVRVSSETFVNTSIQEVNYSPEMIRKMDVNTHVRIIARESVPDSEKFVHFLPYYSMCAACGKFGQVEDFIEENGWIEVDGNLNERMFVVKACGDSMKGDIENEDYCVFQNYDTGHSYEGKIVLSQIHEQDSDYKGSYTIKYYHRDKVWDDELNREIAKRVVLSPSNHAYPPIVIDQNPENYRVIGEFIKKL